jgi:hypothetical protein
MALVGAGRAFADSKKFQRTGERGVTALMLSPIASYYMSAHPRRLIQTAVQTPL